MQPLNKYNRKERIGHMRDRILVQSYTEAVNAFGERAKTWTTTATVWAKVEITTGTESEQAGQETAMPSAKFTIRKRTINERNRISFKSQLYDIITIIESECRQYQTIMAKRFKE